MGCVLVRRGTLQTFWWQPRWPQAASQLYHSQVQGRNGGDTGWFTNWDGGKDNTGCRIKHKAKCNITVLMHALSY